MAELGTDTWIRDTEILYPAEDAQQILGLAIAQKTETGELSRAQLLEVAAELGIAPDTLLAAEQEWEIKKYELADQRLFDRQRKSRFHHGLVKFLIFGSFALIFQLVTGGWLWNWILYLTFGPWALELIWDWWRIYRPNEYSYNQEFQRWRRKQQVQRAMGGAAQRVWRALRGS